MVFERSGFGDVEHASAGWIDDPHLALETDDQEAGRQAGDDLAAQPLGGFRPSRRRALLGLELGDGFLKGRRQERHVARVSLQVAARVPRRRGKPQDREGERRGDGADHGGETEQGAGAWCQGHRLAGYRKNLAINAECKSQMQKASWHCCILALVHWCIGAFLHSLLHQNLRYQSRRDDPTVAASPAPRARNVPNGKAYFMSPRRVAMSSSPTSAPANEAVISVTSVSF